MASIISKTKFCSYSFVRMGHPSFILPRLLSSVWQKATSAASRLQLSEPHTTRIDGMMEGLLSEDTNEGRLAHAMRICAFTKQHSIKPWLLGETMRDFYAVLSSCVRASSVEGIIGLMKCLHPQDPFVKSMLRALSQHGKDLDFHNCIYLVHLSVQSPRLVPMLKPFYARLREHLVRLMMVDADLSGAELVRAISLLITVRHYSRNTSDVVGAYLARHLHRLDVDSVHSFLPHITGGVKLHGIRCHPQFVEAVSCYFLELLNRSSGMEDRTEVWGPSYGYSLSRFLRFYGGIKFYDERVCEKIKEIFLGPFDPNIHNPILMSSLAYMCGQTLYFDRDLVEYIMQLSCNQVESFHVNELKEMLLAFQNLNFDHQLFLARVVEVTLRSYDVMHSCDLYWSIINSSIFMNTYYSELLDRFLTDSMLEGKCDNPLSQNYQYDVHPGAIIYLLLHIDPKLLNWSQALLYQ